MFCNRIKNTSDVFNQISCSESLTVPSFQRVLKPKSKKKDKEDKKEDKVIPPLMAQLNSTTSKASVEGWVGVAHKDGFLVVDFDLATSFEGCMKCHISLLSSCEEDAEEHHSEDMVSPYNVTHSGFRTNSQGRAAGLIPFINNGYGFDKNKCMYLGIHGPVVVDEVDAKKSKKKSKKPKKARRRLSDKKDDDKEEEPEKEVERVACGMLLEVGENIYSCDDW